ncbi:MAG: UPF0164 family protein [candidate division WOR-3 bacterium]
MQREIKLAIRLLGTFILVLPIYAIFEDLESGTRAEGIAGAYTAIADDALAIHFNPAGLAQIENLQIYTFFKSLFSGVDDRLHTMALDLTYPNKRWGSLGISIYESGVTKFSQRSLTFAHGFYLARDLAFGYSLSGYNLAIENFGQGYTFGIDVGCLAKIYKRWRLGFFAHNLNMPTMGKEDKSYLPRLLNFGIAYSPIAGINSCLDISKELGKDFRIMAGQELEIIPKTSLLGLTLRTGVSTEPVRFAFGCGIGLRSLNIDYALFTHSELPLTHNIGINLLF